MAGLSDREDGPITDHGLKKMGVEEREWRLPELVDMCVVAPVSRYQSWEGGCYNVKDPKLFQSHRELAIAMVGVTRVR